MVQLRADLQDGLLQVQRMQVHLSFSPFVLKKKKSGLGFLLFFWFVVGFFLF